MTKICIIGGGISGLSIARKKKHEGNKIKLLESSGRIGGVIQSVREGGYLLDYGANTLNVRLKSTKSILENCDAWSSSIEANSLANKRMIVKNGKLIALPSSFGSFMKSPFLSAKGKFRILLEPFVKKSREQENESVASFFSRRFGNEVLQYAANPFLAGIYAAKPESLNLNQTFPTISNLEKEYGSIVWGLLKTRKEKINTHLRRSKLISYAGGMEELIGKLSSSIQSDIHLNHEVLKVGRKENMWKLSYNHKNQLFEEVFDQVISTVPSHKINSIKWDNLIKGEKLDILTKAKHYPLTLVFLGFPRKMIAHPLDGFGFLVPECENLNILGTLFSSTLFPERAPKDHVLLTTFVGGERKPGLTLLPDSEIFSIVVKELNKLLGLKGNPSFKSLKKWEQAIPLPDKSMKHRKNAASELQEANEGLFFCGSFLSGVSLPNCLEMPY